MATFAQSLADSDKRVHIARAANAGNQGMHNDSIVIAIGVCTVAVQSAVERFDESIRPFTAGRDRQHLGNDFAQAHLCVGTRKTLALNPMFH